MHTKAQLREDLAALGVCPGDKLLIHSSYRSLGGIEGGAAGFFETVTDLLGSEGTLILPTLSYATVGYDQPCFDVRRTPSCVGYLTEYFRTQVPGVIRSLHASHSCAVYGRDAAAWAEGHQLDLTPVGEHSPLRKLPQQNGKILMLGCDPGRNTSMHGVEELADAPYLFGERRVRYLLTDLDGRIIEQTAFRHGHVRGDVVYVSRYARLLPMLQPGEIARGNVLDAACVLMSAPAVWQRAADAMRKDPYAFTEALPAESMM